jgi:lipopolysaccharide export system protein LptA
MRLTSIYLIFMPFAANLSAGEENATRPTTIDSDMAELVTTKDGHRFYFAGNVVVVGTDLLLKCNELEILSKRETNSSKSSAKVGKISLMVARGEVIIKQKGSLGTGNKATMQADTGLFILHGSPAVLVDERGILEGNEIVFERGKGRAELRGGAENRPRVELPELPALPNFGRGSKKKKSIEEKRTP